MKSSDFQKTVQDTPVHYPVFSVSSIPAWAQGMIEKGDLVYYLPSDVFVAIVSGRNLGLGCSSVNFKGYWTREEITKYRTEKIFAGVYK